MCRVTICTCAGSQFAHVQGHNLHMCRVTICTCAGSQFAHVQGHNLHMCRVTICTCAGSQSDCYPQSLPPGSKLTMLMDTCYKSVHATPASQLKAVQLMSACAVADAGLYIMLLPELEQIMWRGHHPGSQVAAAAGANMPVIVYGRC